MDRLAELAIYHPALRLEAPQRVLDHRDPKAESNCRVGGGERPVRSRVPGEQVAKRVANGLEERRRHTDRKGRTQGVPESGRVLDRGPPLLAPDPQPKDSVRALQLHQPTGHQLGGRGPGGGL